MSDENSLRNCLAPAKLNLFLHITGRRTDGYHMLQSAFQLLDWGDTLHFSCRNDGQIMRRDPIAGVPAEQDLTVKAARLLQTYANCPLGVEIEIEKSIPMGAGLGGGSSDAATTLLALNQLWHLALPRVTLQTLALQLGADVPVFIFGQNAFAEGIGEKLSALELPLLHYLVVTPAVQVATAEIYGAQELTRNSELITIMDFLAAQKTDHVNRSCADGRWAARFGRNDMQAVVVKKYPEVAQVLDWFAAEQITPARMSGSGASVFAAFAQREQAEAAYVRLQSSGASDWKSIVASGIGYHPLFSYAA